MNWCIESDQITIKADAPTTCNFEFCMSILQQKMETFPLWNHDAIEFDHSKITSPWKHILAIGHGHWQGMELAHEKLITYHQEAVYRWSINITNRIISY